MKIVCSRQTQLGRTDEHRLAFLELLSEPKIYFRWYINHDTVDPSYVSNQTTEVVSEDKDGPGLIILDEEKSKFPDVVMRLRSPLKYDLDSSAEPDSDQDSRGLFSVIRLHFVIRDKQMRMGDG